MEEALFLELLGQGIDVTAIGVPFARRAYPDLNATAPVDAYSQGFLDGLSTFGALLPLLTEGPTYDPAEWVRRLYDPDCLPVG